MNTLKDRIIDILDRRPYWGPQTVAKAAGTTNGVVRSTAAREGIKFMDRYEAEAYMDSIMEVLEKARAGSDGQAQ